MCLLSIAVGLACQDIGGQLIYAARIAREASALLGLSGTQED